MHITQAITMLLYPAAMKATSTLGVVRAFEWLNIPDGYVHTAEVMIVCALTALVGTFFRWDSIRLLLFIPQQIILGLMVGGALLAIALGRYLDGTPIDSAHIFVDQCVWIILFLLHWDAIKRRSREPNQ